MPKGGLKQKKESKAALNKTAGNVAGVGYAGLSDYETALLEMMSKAAGDAMPNIYVSPRTHPAYLGAFQRNQNLIDLTAGRHNPVLARGLYGFSGKSPMTPQDSSFTLAHELGHAFSNKAFNESEADRNADVLLRVLTGTNDPKAESDDMQRWLKMLAKLRQ